MSGGRHGREIPVAGLRGLSDPVSLWLAVVIVATLVLGLLVLSAPLLATLGIAAGTGAALALVLSALG